MVKSLFMTAALYGVLTTGFPCSSRGRFRLMCQQHRQGTQDIRKTTTAQTWKNQTRSDLAQKNIPI